MATWEDARGTRWVLDADLGAVASELKVPVSHGRSHTGDRRAEARREQWRAGPDAAWMSRDMDLAERGRRERRHLYLRHGEGRDPGNGRRRPELEAPRRIRVEEAVLYRVDAQTGRELYSSGSQIASWNHFSGLSVANGRVYIGTFDGMLYCFGL